jgi:hypothetical protein
MLAIAVLMLRMQANYDRGRGSGFFQLQTTASHAENLSEQPLPSAALLSVGLTSVVSRSASAVHDFEFA